MTQSQRNLAALGGIQALTEQALQTKDPIQLMALDRKAQWLEADLTTDSLSAKVWFDLPPNEWWDAN